MSHDGICPECGSGTVYAEDIAYIDEHGRCRACQLEDRIQAIVRKEKERARQNDVGTVAPAIPG